MFSIYIIIFILYSSLIFFIDDIYIILVLNIINLILLFLLKIKILEYLKFIKKNIIFLLFIFISNILFTSIIDSLIIVLRLLLILSISFIIYKKSTLISIYYGFNNLLKPFKIFNIDTRSISIILALSLTLIPIFIKEVNDLKLCFNNHSCKLNFNYIIKNPQTLFITFFNNLFTKIDLLELGLKSKSFE